MSTRVYFDASSFDIAAKGYFNNIKEALKPEKFHVQAPTPQLLRKAQKAAVELRRPIPRDGQGRILPHPSRGTKSDIFKKEDFANIDYYALNAPASLLTVNIEELVDYLVTPYENDDVAIVRAIFKWVSGQDLLHYEIQSDVSPNCAAYFLNELKNGKGRYDKIFNLMCKHAQIPSATISGHSKGTGYNVGDPVTSSTRNMWNAVLLGEDWYLIDVHWASRKVSGIEAEEWQLIDVDKKNAEEMVIPQDIYEFDEFYFLTDPEEFIYSHFPDQEVWQLLARPMTLTEFQKVILLKPKFFQFDLKVKSHPWCTLKSVDGIVNIELSTDREDLSFSYELYRSKKVDSGQQGLQKYLFLERNPEEKKLCVEIRFPTTGKFKLEIYGKDSKSKLEWLCSYVLYCEKPEANCMALPTNLRSEWGPSVSMKKAGVVPLTHKSGKIFVDRIETEIKFKLNPNVDLIAQLMSVDEENMERYILLGVSDDIATVYVRIPQKGHYALCLYAKTDPSQQQFVNICNYLVTCTEEFGVAEPYPQTTNSRVGPLEIFYKLGLKMIDHLTGLSTVSQDGKCAVNILIPEEIQYFPRLTLSTKDDFSEFVGWYRHDDNVNFKLRFPKAGFYKFSLFAKSANEEGGYPEVLCLVLEAPWPMINCLPFPKKFSSYKDYYQISSPSQKFLAIDKPEKVNVFLPDAEQVAFIEGDRWTPLEKKEGGGTWEGLITPTGAAESISMAAKLSESETNFSAILAYEVIPEKDLNHMFLAQRLAREEADQEYLEQMSRRDNVCKNSQNNSMINQIQRIAKMKQQNLDDETLQRIQLQVENEDDFNDNNIDVNFSAVNNQAKDIVNEYFENMFRNDNPEDIQNYNTTEDPYILIREEEDEEEDEEEKKEKYDENEKNEQEEQEQSLISNVDINLNNIIKEPINETVTRSKVKSDVFAENTSHLDESRFILDSQSSLKDFEEISQENIPLSFSDQDNIEKHSLQPLQISKIEQSMLEKPVSPDITSDEPISISDEKLSDSGNSSNEDNFELFPSVPKSHEELMVSIKPKLTTAPPPPSTPGDDFTDELVKKVAEMEKSVENEELALKTFSYEELKGIDETILTHRPLLPQSAITNDAVTSTSFKDENPISRMRPSSLQANQDEEVPLIKFVEYFVYFVSLLSILLYIYRILSWRPY